MLPSNVLMGGSIYLIGFFSVYKADGILKELRPLVENKEDISVSIIIINASFWQKYSCLVSSGPNEYLWSR